MNSNISDLKITIRDLVKGYKNSDEDGVYGYGGDLIIRPEFQREFVYKDAQRDAVVDSVMNGYPIGIMYWSLNKSGKYECLDGQQRTISICDYVNNGFSVKIAGYPKIFSNLNEDEKESILNYEVTVYIFSGNETERLEWFKRINTQGEKLNNQELLNAVYTGTWLNDARRYFSKRGCRAIDVGKGYITGNAIEQVYLRKVLTWASDSEGIKHIEDYMSKHQNDKDASGLWVYYQNVINWANIHFSYVEKKIREKQDWGILYNKYHNKTYNPKELEGEINKLIGDDEVTNHNGIVPYVLSDKTPSDERYLTLRSFSDAVKRRVYNDQTDKAKANGTSNCPYCAEKNVKTIYLYTEMEGDHIVPWSKGGKTEESNLQMLCRSCNNNKRDK